MINWKWIVSWGLILASGFSVTAQQGTLDPQQPYQGVQSKRVTYDVDCSIVVTAPAGTRRLAVWIPIPPSDNAQQVSHSEFSTFPIELQPQRSREARFGNEFAYFEVAQPQGAIQFRHRYQVTTCQMEWELDPRRVDVVESWPASFAPYGIDSQQPAVVDERFAQVLSEIVPRRSGPAEDLQDVMEWVETNFEYDHHDASLRADAEHGLLKRRGHCSDYHSFCAALGRILGVPTRVTYGLHTFPKNSPSHCKLEAFLPPYGWVSFDVSETQKMCAAIRAADLPAAERQRLEAAAQTRLLRGFRDNTWILQTRGTNFDLSPPSARGPVPVVRTAYIEADGVPLPEPDPADSNQKTFAWMTVLKFESAGPRPYPFKDFSTLERTSSQ